MVHIYCGDGKGKTTSAVGLSVRCASYGKKVSFIQFLKNSSSGEICVLKKIENLTVRCFQETVDGFFFCMSEEEKKALKNETQNGLDFVEKTLISGSCDMLVLDEIGGCIENGMVSEREILNLIENYGDKTEIVLTGRNFSENLKNMADYVSEIREIKHPYKEGIPSREGIEY